MFISNNGMVNSNAGFLTVISPCTNVSFENCLNDFVVMYS